MSVELYKGKIDSSLNIEEKIFPIKVNIDIEIIGYKEKFMIAVKEELEKSNKGMKEFNWNNLWQVIEEQFKQVQIDEKKKMIADIVPGSGWAPNFAKILHNEIEELEKELKRE